MSPSSAGCSNTNLNWAGAPVGWQDATTDLIYLPLHIDTDSTGALVQHGPLGPVVEQPGQAHALLLPAREDILPQRVIIRNMGEGLAHGLTLAVIS